MQLVIFREVSGVVTPEPRLGLLLDDGVVPVDLVPAPTAGAALKRAIADFDGLRHGLAELAGRSAPVPRDRVRLLPPLADPAKILGSLWLPMQHSDTENRLHVFLKATGSAIGDGDDIVLPRLEGAEVFTHNACLAVVIGRRCRGVTASAWRDVVFGYTAMVDVTARTADLARWKDGTSALGSSVDTFGPLGPAIVPRADVEDGDGMELRLLCSGQLRQHARFDDLDARIGPVIERATSVMTLHPGDVIAIGGTTDGQGPLQDGDDLRVELSGIGSFSVSVRDPWGRAWDRSLRSTGEASRAGADRLAASR